MLHPTAMQTEEHRQQGPQIHNLASQGLIKADAAERIRSQQRAGTPLDEAILAESNGDMEQVLRKLADEFALPFVDLEKAQPHEDLLNQFPARILLEHKLFPLEQVNGQIMVATSRIFDSSGLDELRLATGLNLKPAVALPEEIDRCINALATLPAPA